MAANYFVRTTTTEKIQNERIQGTDAVVNAHHEVGAQTRALIESVGATKPENLPPEPSIRPLLDQRARRQKQQKQLPQPQSSPSLFDTTGQE